MFCTKCGNPIIAGNKFCTKCGQPVPEVAAPTPQETVTPAAEGAAPAAPAAVLTEPKAPEKVPETPAPESPAAAPAPKKAKKKRSVGKTVALCVLIPLVIALLGAGGYLGWRVYRDAQQSKQYEETMGEAEKLLADGQYEDAAERYEKVLKKSPDSAEAVLGLAEAYLRQGKYADGADVLKELKLDEGDRNAKRYNELLAVATLDPELAELNADDFPTVRLTVTCNDPDALSQESFVVRESGEEQTVTGFDKEQDGVVLTYEAAVGEVSAELRDVSVSLEQSGFVFDWNGTYNTPAFEPVEIDLVSGDVSGYPTVILNLSVTKSSDMSVRSLSREDFALQERMGTKYEAREIVNARYLRSEGVYQVEYVSDPDADPYAARSLKLSVAGDEFRGAGEASFIPSEPAESSYEIVAFDGTWEDANEICQSAGGHLATITSAEEEAKLIEMAEDAGLKYIWLGGYTAFHQANGVVGYWSTGEDFTYSNWGENEPSGRDQDGTPESYIMLWDPRGTWCWNDQRNDPLAVAGGMAGQMGFICEFDG